MKAGRSRARSASRPPSRSTPPTTRRGRPCLRRFATRRMCGARITPHNCGASSAVSAGKSVTVSSGKPATTRTPTGSKIHWAANTTPRISSSPSPAATMRTATRRSAAALPGSSATTTPRPTRPRSRNGRPPSPRPTPSSSPRSTCSRVQRGSHRPSSTTSAVRPPISSRRGSRSSTPASPVPCSICPPVRLAPRSALIFAKRNSSEPPMKIPSAAAPPPDAGRTGIFSIPFPGAGRSTPASPRFAYP